FSSELAAYKEQIKQHSLTIVEFEKEIIILREKELEYKGKIIQLEKSLQAKPNKTVTFTAPPPAAVVQNNEHELTCLNKTIDLLRGECATYKRRLIEQDELIRTLRR